MLSMVSLGALLAPLNSTMLAVALPEIRDDFGLANSTVGWLISSYLIAMAVAQPVAGRIGDELGRLRVYRLALLAFLGFSLAAALAPTFATLVAARTLQAIAGAVLVPNGIGMLRAAVPPERFGTFSGFLSSSVGATAAVGPLLGAGILLVAPWRALFLANIPFVLVAFLLTWQIHSPGRADSGRTRIEPVGLLLFAVLLALATWGFNSLRTAESGFRFLIVATTLGVAVVFVLQQRAALTPVASWSLFRLRGFVGASSHILLMNLVMYTTLLSVPFFVTDVQGKSAAVAGVLLGAMAGLQALSAPFAGRVSDAIGRRSPALFSSAVALAASFMLLLRVSEDIPFWYLATAVTVLGLGVGVGFVTAAAAATESVPVALSGAAAGTQSMMRYAGSIVGTGVLTGLLATKGAGASPDTFRALFVVVTAIAALSFAAAALIRPFPAKEH